MQRIQSRRDLDVRQQSRLLVLFILSKIIIAIIPSVILCLGIGGRRQLTTAPPMPMILWQKVTHCRLFFFCRIRTVVPYKHQSTRERRGRVWSCRDKVYCRVQWYLDPILYMCWSFTRKYNQPDLIRSCPLHTSHCRIKHWRLYST